MIFILLTGLYVLAIVAFIGFLVYQAVKTTRDKNKQIVELQKKLAAADAELDALVAKHGLGKR